MQLFGDANLDGFGVLHSSHLTGLRSLQHKKSLWALLIDERCVITGKFIKDVSEKLSKHVSPPLI